MTNEIAIIDQGATAIAIEPTPADVIAQATARADALSGVVEKQGLYATISGKKHLLAEAWQTVSALNHCHNETEWVRPIRDDDEEITGFLAKVNLVDANGTIIGSGIMPCGYDDFPCLGKRGTGRDRAAMSAAQTWAGSKAARQTFAWVVTLAGYSPTPRDEMLEDGGKPAPTPARRPAQRRNPAPRANGPDNWDWDKFVSDVKETRGDDFRADLERIFPKEVHSYNSKSLREFAESQKLSSTAELFAWCKTQWDNENDDFGGVQGVQAEAWEGDHDPDRDADDDELRI